MQFKNPEILYALFLLLIPIFIHLFQLRRFKKIAFTNVAFLKKVTLQTRKSSRLKKWLTLLLRLLAFASIILAFAQPFIASKTALNTQQETVIYIDNSFSMQAKGQNGVLLKQALQQLYDAPLKTQTFNWFTNDKINRNTTLQNFKEDILKTEYTYKQLPLQQVLLKAKQLFSKNKNSIKRLLLISDFQQKDPFPEIPEDITLYAVQFKPVNKKNISIDTLVIESKSATKYKLKAKLTSQQKIEDVVSVSVFNKNKLLAKTALNFNEKTTQFFEFDINNNVSVDGKISINDPVLLYDNTYYFSVSKPEKINVLSVNQASSGFLQRIFTPEEFNLTQQSFSSLDYNLLDKQNLIILNELETTPTALQNALLSFTQEGGSLLIIPSDNSDLASYNNLFKKLKLPAFKEKIKQKRKITKIAFSHPVYQGVFEKKVANFQYPSVQSFYDTESQNSVLLSFEDDSPLLFNRKNVYVSTAAFNNTNSTLKNAPLIVPTLYNIAKHSTNLPQLSYEIGNDTKISISTQLSKDQVLTIKDTLQSFIPLQNSKRNSVAINTQEKPDKAGNYGVYKNEEKIIGISYNYPRNESNLTYLDIAQWKNCKPFNTVKKLIDTIAGQNNITNLWKWFVLASLLFLLLEMLVLKFFKS